MAPKPALDAKVRAWLRDQVQGQQKELGEALKAAGVGGQSWVSKYVTGGPATATADHLQVIADFFERDLADMLREAKAYDLLRQTTDQESAAQGGSQADVKAPRKRVLISHASKDAEIAALKARLREVEVLTRELFTVATDEEMPDVRGSYARKASVRGSRGKAR